MEACGEALDAETRCPVHSSCAGILVDGPPCPHEGGGEGESCGCGEDVEGAVVKGKRRGGEDKTVIDVGGGRSLKIFCKYREDESVWPAGMLLARCIAADQWLHTLAISSECIVEMGTGTGYVLLLPVCGGCRSGLG